MGSSSCSLSLSELEAIVPEERVPIEAVDDASMNCPEMATFISGEAVGLGVGAAVIVYGKTHQVHKQDI